MNNITLQINLSGGDINYAHLSVPALVEQHRDIKNRLLVVDCCRPQKSKVLNPDIKFPKAEFECKVEKITQIAKELLKDKTVTELHFVKPGDPMIPYISKKYLRSLYKKTHGAGGTGNMSYWIGVDLPKTRFVLHYDADMMLYQKPGYSWVNAAINEMKAWPEVIFSTPRLCPPINDPSFDLPSLQEGRVNKSHQSFWLNDFFSTRQFLVDKERLNKYLPLVQGKVMFELLLRKFAKRTFPLDPEIIMMKSLGPRGGRRLVLKNKNAWVLHPLEKSQAYLDILPQIISSISAGYCPEEQQGHENIKLDSWIDFLKKGNPNIPV